MMSTKKKRLGAFYTPSEASRILCDWAIRSADDYILEPSFGGCGFLLASRSRLTSLGSRKPDLRLCGCDIDRQAFQHLSERLGPVDIRRRFLLGDFLALRPHDFRVIGFDVIIGNPPYVSHHNMSKSQKSRAVETMAFAGFVLDGKASLWAYFVLHGLRFLREGGRMAWLLPGSFVHADYGKEVKEVLDRSFARVVAVVLGERLFADEGSDENTVVLLAEGRGLGPAAQGVEIEHAPSVRAFERIITGLLGGTWTGNRLNGRSAYSLLSAEGRKCFEDLANHPFAMRLGELMDMSIGIVTGSNKFFIINQEIARNWDLPARVVKLILPKLNIAKGLRVTKHDLEQAKARNVRCLLLDTSETRRSRALERYLASFLMEERERVLTFRKRRIWHEPDDKRVPDAFLSYMSQRGPRLVLNSAKTTCPNSVHRIFFKENTPRHVQKVVAISLLSSYSQLSAEIEGRSYGSGVLKHELGEAKKISVLIPDTVDLDTIDSVFLSVDERLRSGKTLEAETSADEFVLGHFAKSDASKLVNVIREELASARAKRLPRTDVILECGSEC